jgi:hypothetical protein
MKCVREYDELPCDRCQARGNVCGSSYLPRDDPKIRITERKIWISDPQEIELVNKFRAQQHQEAMESSAVIQNSMMEAEELWAPLGPLGLQNAESERAITADESQTFLLMIGEFLIEDGGNRLS